MTHLHATTIVCQVVNYVPDLDAVFGALADPTRRGMLDRLAGGPQTVGNLGAPFGLSKGAISKHLKVLERAGFIRRTVEGRQHHIEMQAAPLEAADAWVENVRTFWEAHLDELGAYLEQLQRTRSKGKTS